MFITTFSSTNRAGAHTNLRLVTEVTELVEDTVFNISFNHVFGKKRRHGCDEWNRLWQILIKLPRQFWTTPWRENGKNVNLTLDLSDFVVAVDQFQFLS